ncbi:MAG: bifunctional folylpolyglutamate synthase/dihydrofolate synthase [Spirochaetes bacterium]|nr:bifunctional folylpolyglutamate synthase/dihydrofolate synthase [Spirochaetota bacterium]
MDRGRFTSTDAIFDYLMRYVNVEKGQATVFKLDRMRSLASALSDPHKGRLTIHIAGSKGKGSVSTMCARLLEETGLKVGLYTSPHLIRWKERIAFASGPMEEKTLIEAMEEILPLVEGKGPSDFPGGEEPTFFELTTLLAFCAFRSTGCNAQVIEVGLGGRLDSTNIVEPDVSVITPIELEHTQFLGDTIAKIAFEKAGIIKIGKPVCVSAQKAEAMEAFEKKAAETQSSLYAVGRDIVARDIAVSLGGTSCTLTLGMRTGDSLALSLSHIIPSGGLEISSPMPGAIQAQNMALALLAAACALPGLSSGAVARGLAKASLPARFEILPGEPTVVLDGAHTPESVRLTIATMMKLFPGKRVLLFACAHDKRHEEMAELLASHFERIIITKPGTFKVSEPEKVFESFKKRSEATSLVAETSLALKAALAEASARGAALLVTGSFYLCAEAKKRLEPTPGK